MMGGPLLLMVRLCFVALFVLLASISATRDAATFDEPAHLVAGVSYWQSADFRLNPEHPPLAKLWAALPVVVTGVDRVDGNGIRWRTARQRELGFELVNGRFDDRERLSPFARLVPARFAMIVLGVALLLVIEAWARELWGRTGGWFALALAALSPTFLAHTRLVTTDVPAALGFTATLWCFWRFCRAPSPARAASTGLALGAAWLFKYSTLLLIPMLILALALWVVWPPPGPTASWTRRRRFALGTGALAVAAVIGIVTIWGAYGFRFAATGVAAEALDWRQVPVASAPLAASIGLVRQHHLLPEGYAYGVSYVLSKADRRTFLNGQILDHGSRWYFPEAFLLKSTPAVLAIALALLGLASTRRGSFDGWFLAIPIALYAAVAVLSPLNIGHRHLVPVYALLFAAAGALGRLAVNRAVAAALGALVVAQALSALTTFPRYLSYFNALAGGPANGWHFLVDSNIDWGQDLGRLGTWTGENGDPLIYLAYFGMADPTVYDIRYRKIVLLEDFEPGRRPVFPASGDYAAVSVSLLQGMYASNPDVTAWLERVRREMTPIARAGDSILIYRMP